MKSLFDEIRSKYREADRVLSAQYEVTHRCPCSCIHCFLLKTPKNELDIEEISDLFAQLKAEGTIDLSITGGEPFLREDMPEILRLARRDGFFVSIQTTGILIGQPEVNLMRKLGVKNVEMSLLGASAETHDSIMQYPGAFKSMQLALERLKGTEISVTLKTVVMQQNYQELSAMAQIADRMGTRFYANTIISPTINGDKAPQQWMINENQAARLDYKLINSGVLSEESTAEGALLTCRAGSTLCGITPDGHILPCIMFRHEVGNIRKNTLQDIWHKNPDPFLMMLRRMDDRDVEECFTCELRSVCRRCPGIAYLETGKVGFASVSGCLQAKMFSRTQHSPEN